MNNSKTRYKTFAEFYSFYLTQHEHQNCRILHYIGSCLGLGFLGFAFWTANYWWILAGLFCGYFFAWVGHFFIEKNRPATFEYPLYSFIGDWVMLYQAVKRRVTGNK